MPVLVVGKVGVWGIGRGGFETRPYRGSAFYQVVGAGGLWP